MFDPSALLTSLGPWMILGVAIIVFIETGLLFPALPGDSLLIAASVAAPAIGVSRTLIIVVAIAAAIAGDQVSYALGSRYGRRLFKESRRILTPERLKSAERFFAKYGGLSLVLARFFPVLRTYTPCAAGVARYQYVRFSLWNAAGAIAWVIGITLLGALLSTMPWIVAHLELVIVAVLLVPAIPVAVTALVRRRGNAQRTR
ncbi:MAG: DedA family protein [Microbacteriaceae bacterium]|jgi:membrane-associated protein|nr:DedA family protein [Microbacteriaceae bacterium]MCI1207254.1 DedA family protein [Microbacteriaceae bacterium]